MRAKSYKVVYFDDCGYYMDRNERYYDDARSAYEKAYKEVKSGGNLGCYILALAEDGIILAKIEVIEHVFDGDGIEVKIHV